MRRYAVDRWIDFDDEEMLNAKYEISLVNLLFYLFVSSLRSCFIVVVTVNCFDL